ncbi:tyrosine-protein phosphatase [Alkalihalobacillus sp. 1P02AB]|uniref:tyrosine-protein phosphatase n=1 Tax=Alkalihalobacillus sp. 1P02AB TaxID=3132260 RepID=UPI0039A47CBF
MIDLHCHILPGLDDGSGSVEESLKMSNIAIKEGITAIVATPHYAHPSFRKNEAPIVREAVQRLNEELKSRNLPLKIYEGHELRIHGDLVSELEQKEALTMAGLDTYAFIEFPSNHVPRYATSLFYQMLTGGYQPVIVHPERNSELIQNPELLYDFVKSGIYTQITASSLTGHNGKNIKKFTAQLVESNLTHIIASDAHNTHNRPFRLREAYEQVEKEFGQDYVEMFQQNAERILDNKAIISDEPQPIRRKKILGIF